MTYPTLRSSALALALGITVAASGCGAVVARFDQYPEGKLALLSGSKLDLFVLGGGISFVPDNADGDLPWPLRVAAFFDLVPSFLLDLALAPVDGIVFALTPADEPEAENQGRD